jgi:hypothetical protein
MTNYNHFRRKGDAERTEVTMSRRRHLGRLATERGRKASRTFADFSPKKYADLAVNILPPGNVVVTTYVAYTSNAPYRRPPASPNGRRFGAPQEA